MQGTHHVANQRLIVQNNAKKSTRLDEAEKTQIPHEVGLTHLVQLPTQWVNAVWRRPDITETKQKATCLENLELHAGNLPTHNCD